MHKQTIKLWSPSFEPHHAVEGGRICSFLCRGPTCSWGTSCSLNTSSSSSTTLQTSACWEVWFLSAIRLLFATKIHNLLYGEFSCCNISCSTQYFFLIYLFWWYYLFVCRIAPRCHDNFHKSNLRGGTEKRTIKIGEIEPIFFFLSKIVKQEVSSSPFLSFLFLSLFLFPLFVQ